MSRLLEATSFSASMPVHDVALWPSLGRWTTAALVALGVWAAGALWSPAQANGVNWSIGIQVPGVIAVGNNRPAVVYPSHGYPVAYPVVTYPQPTYLPVVYPPPAPVYGYPPRAHVPPPHHHWRHHGHGHRPERQHGPYAQGGRAWDDGYRRYGDR